MPTYVFKCSKCNATVELYMKASEYNKPTCCAEGCDGNSIMDVQLQPTAVKFKGSGWTPKYGKE